MRPASIFSNIQLSNSRLARKEPASYVSIAMRPGGLQDYVDVWNKLN